MALVAAGVPQLDLGYLRVIVYISTYVQVIVYSL